MDAAFSAEEPVSVLAGGLEGCRLDSGLLPRAGFEQFDLKAAALGPAHHHPQDHLSPILSVRTAGAGVDCYERVAGVIVASEETLLLKCREPALDVAELAFELASQGWILIDELQHRRQVVAVARQLLPSLEAARNSRVLGADSGRLILIVPEAGCPHLRFQIGDPASQFGGVEEAG
ncbi:unannotated protein [freshwater metagenome]|uniref:Unannotated protein n=1 Tax=freshwater metagenome TaxID=449393 RepID=A0A6J7RXH4_9ZZZZ